MTRTMDQPFNYGYFVVRPIDTGGWVVEQREIVYGRQYEWIREQSGTRKERAFSRGFDTKQEAMAACNQFADKVVWSAKYVFDSSGNQARVAFSDRFQLLHLYYHRSGSWVVSEDAASKNLDPVEFGGLQFPFTRSFDTKSDAKAYARETQDDMMFRTLRILKKDGSVQSERTHPDARKH